MLGTVAGDIAGSVYEFANRRTKDFGPLFHERSRFTDDTVCTVAVADALVNERDPVRALQDWGRRYWDNGGWGQRFALWLADDGPKPYGSWGNGAAMRVAPAALLATSLEEALALSDHVTRVTHDHPEGLKGAAATAAAIWLARQDAAPDEIRREITTRFGYDLSMTVDSIRPTYRHDESCQRSVPQALVCALEATGFEDAIRNAISIGGDSDTLAAMAGSIAEARFGMPEAIAKEAWSRLPDDMRRVLAQLYALHVQPLRAPKPDGGDA
ncbi:ADP-ribosylglycohydrolase family protein [Azohydromonas lata]|uniref:ADP-ribosylglycohydrolase family protein n=1 Tax=Azohydromonas lata TaxID=45677 RepID=A0ABU5I851_9BURK|nr:ADP-ribosylglycohydrolase family protein [Azohydromonas lata]MDZ5455275.1 ADP-ribosylglycohydrolase family protein [Azohydromonas lata]